jgi:hypothetical protein
MRTALTFIAVLSLAHAVCATPQDDVRNAATWYRRAIEKYRSIEVSDADWMEVYNFEGDISRGPSPTARRVLSKYQSVIDLVDRATAQDDYDPQHDFANGPNTDYQAISDSRRLAHLLHYDMCVRIHDGDSSTAAERAASVYRIGNHQKADGRYVGSLVSEALFHFGEHFSNELTDFAMLGPAEASKILAAVDSLDERDPFGYQQSVKNEKEFVIEWAREQFTGEGGVERLAQDCDWLADLSTGEVSSMRLATIAGMSQESLDASLAECGRMMDIVVNAFSNPDSEKAQADLAALDEQIKRPDANPLIAMVMNRPGFSKLYERTLASKQKISERRAMLQSVIEGKFDAKAHANAAIWYLRATLAISQLDQAMLDRVREYLKTNDQAPGESVRDFLASKDVQSILQTLREATQIKRCDFEVASPWEGLFPAYQPGLRDAARLLVADAAVQLQNVGEDNVDTAVDRLATCFAMGAHLAADKLALTAMIAHANFNDAADVAGRALDAKRLTNDHRAILKTTLANLNAVDPFGYERTITATRELLQKWFGYTIRNDEREALEAIQPLMKQADADRIIWLTAIAHRSNYRDSPPPFDVVERLKHCADFIDLEALQTTFDHAMEVRNMMARGESDRVLAMEYPNIASIAAKSRQAGDDVSRLQRSIDGSRATE